MPATLIDGNRLAESYRQQIRARVAALRARGGSVSLDAVLVESGDSAARIYAENQGKTCAALGIGYRLHELPGSSGFLNISLPRISKASAPISSTKDSF